MECVEGRPAHDHLDETRRGRARDLFFADEASVAKHGDAVGDAEDLIETMGDIDHAHAAGLERAHRGEQPLDLIGRQACRGLIEHQEVAVDSQGAGDGDQRFLGPAQRLDAGVRIEVAADQAQRVSSRFRRSAPIDDDCATEEGGAGKAARQSDILGHRHPFDEAQILMNEGYRMAAVAPAGEIGGAVDGDGAGIRFVDAAENLDQSRLAGAVLSQERDDLAPPHLEADALQRLRSAERLDDAVETKGAGSAHRRPSARTRSAAERLSTRSM